MKKIEIDWKNYLKAVRAKHKQYPNSNEIHGYTFDLDLLYHCFLQNKKGEIFELWHHKEVEKKNEKGEVNEKYAVVYAYKIIPQYQGGYGVKGIAWHFESLNEAINRLGKMRLFLQLENASDGVHRFESEIYKYLTGQKASCNSEVEISTFSDDDNPF